MRLFALAALIALVASSVALAPVDARPSPVCLQSRSACPDDACVDKDLDGQWTSNDACIGMACPHTGCCGGPCPPPPAATVDLVDVDADLVDVQAPAWIGVCTEKEVNAALVYVIVEYGTGVGCYGAEIGECHLQYYPGEPNTPMWVCEPILRL